MQKESVPPFSGRDHAGAGRSPAIPVAGIVRQDGKCNEHATAGVAVEDSKAVRNGKSRRAWLSPEEPFHAHQDREIPPGRVLVLQKHLLAVCPVAQDIHP